MIKWAGFTIAGGPDLNGVSHTSLMVAGVTWTLCYEWFFYISLPIIALASFIRTPVWVIAVCLLALMIQLHFGPPRGSILSIFLGGILAALLSGIETFRRFSKSKLASFVVAFSLLVEASGFSTSYAIAPLALLVLSFCLIANGADLFGILSHPLSRVLGEISYGIYLIQGLVLFIYWKYVITIDIASHVGSFTYWLLQSICVPVLLVVSYFAFRYIERPAINSVPVLHKYLVKRLKPKSNLAEEGG
jgi:peptidoglycan/LPS O-acetylase OafA/YrhL